MVNFRPEYQRDWMQKSWYRQIPLAPLGAEAMRELLADLLGTDPEHRRAGRRDPRAHRRQPVLHRGGGAVADRVGALEGTRGAYRLVSAGRALEVPATVQAVLAARIDRLPEREKRCCRPAR